MNDILGFVFSTGGPLVALLAAAFWSWLRPGSNACRRFLMTVALVYSLASIYAVPVAGSRLIGSGYRQFSPDDVSLRPTALVVLGGSALTVQGWGPEALSVTSVADAARVLEAFRVYKLVDPAWIISSSGPPAAPAGAQPDSVVMRDVLVRLGVPESRILLESTSRNTYQQAVLIGPMLRSLNVEQLILVTSDVHMPRAMGTFRTQGWSAVPAIAPNPHLADPWRTWILPSDIGLSLSGNVVHEVVGIGYYWMRGRWRP